MKNNKEDPNTEPVQTIAPMVYFRVAVQCFLTLFMLWYFVLRFVEAFVLPLIISLRPNHELHALDGVYLLGGSFAIALIIVLVLVKRGIRDEMKKKISHFSSPLKTRALTSSRFE